MLIRIKSRKINLFRTTFYLFIKKIIFIKKVKLNV